MPCTAIMPFRVGAIMTLECESNNTVKGITSRLCGEVVAAHHVPYIERAEDLEARHSDP